MILEILNKIGLSDGEVKVYSSLLDLGTSTLNNIHEKTAIERRNIYDILNKLIEKGFVSYTIEKGRRTYQITHPNKILSYIEQKQYNLTQIKKEILKEIPLIIKKFEITKPEIKAEVYRGKEGIKSVFEDMLNYKQNYFIGGGWYVVRELPYFWPHYNKRRIKLGIKWYNLVRYEFRKEKKPEERFVQIKFLPKEFSGSPNVVFIYGDKVTNVLWSDQFFAFMIQSKEIAENYKQYHKYLWDNIAKLEGRK